MMNRRTFLGACAASASLGAPRRIIDTHTHFYDPSRPQGVPWPSKSDKVLYRTVLPKHFAELTRPYGVTGTIKVEASAWLEDNQWVLDLARDNPIVVGVVGHLDPASNDFRKYFDRFRKNKLFLGIRLGSRAIADGMGKPEFVANLKAMAEARLELDAIGGTDLFAALARLTDRLPKLRVVINHLPFEPHGEDAAFRDLGKRPQVFAKVSGVLRKSGGRVPTDVGFYRESLDRMWENFGEDRLVYGSNWPVSDLVAPYGAVIGLVKEYFAGKGVEAEEKYFWRNSVKAYGWKL